mgnify:CR=1 FL=1
MTEHIPDTESDGDTDLDSLDVQLAALPLLDDDELGRVLEALLLVVDTPASVESLAAATEQPPHRIAERRTESPRPVPYAASSSWTTTGTGRRAWRCCACRRR